jgi:hypothetical protein
MKLDIKMKREVLSFIVTKPKRRVHQMLFDDDLPFKGKREQRKDGYQRKPKHRIKEYEF